jgi:hypothetical protein
VSSDWIAAVFGILGTVVGAGATLIANWLSTRTQLVLAERDREDKKAEVRRIACAKYLIAADSFADHARELASRMDQKARAEDCEAAHKPYSAGWEKLQHACAPVVIAGPDKLGEQAELLKSKLGSVGDLCDSWYVAYQKGSTRSRISDYSEARLGAEDARKNFVSAAQKETAQPSS